MDLQADINWIKSELNKVTDPNLIEAFKNLLTYRKSNNESDDSLFSTSVEELKSRAEISLEEVENGNTRSIDEFKKEIESWKSRKAI